MPAPPQPLPGQRWTSETEPELGLGIIERVGLRTVTVAFRATATTREYALASAPLRRARFHPGTVTARNDGTSCTIVGLREERGLVYYRTEECGEVSEADLADTMGSTGPEDRLLAGDTDSIEAFELRVAALRRMSERRRSPIRGFIGGRVELIPHQLFIAAEVSSRLAPRVLLADEVGLGKTIEAGLILQRLIQTGRAQRVLILVPEPLIHQWFVELLRRFNLWFHLFDEERCQAIEATDPDRNPFLDDQYVLASIGLLTGNPRRSVQAVAAGWDLLIVDEAHHLTWTPEQAGDDYRLVESLCQSTPGLLLLTATPEQSGIASHFARLRLLDPDRFHRLDDFLAEAATYRDIARLADALLDGRMLSDSEARVLAGVLGHELSTVQQRIARLAPPHPAPSPSQTDSPPLSTASSHGLYPTQDVVEGNRHDPEPAAVRQAFLDDLLDRHGTGRVVLRNTRATVPGFPRRIVHLESLPPMPDHGSCLERLADEFAADTRPAASFQPRFERDPRIVWLADLLRRLGHRKVLLICRTQSKAESIHAALKQHIDVACAVFHEGIPLVQRDRSAAWFAEPDGARLLLCSELGSEGRNFQFAQHLVLFDLPLDPELLEQRIGRLDRIGQCPEIHIHVPFVSGSPQEALARWFHVGLDAFACNLHGGRTLLEQFGTRIHDLAQDFHETGAEGTSELDRLIADTRRAREDLAHQLREGRDRLLELNSCRPVVAARLIEAIQRTDADRSLETFMLAVFERFMIQVEELTPRTYRLGSTGVFADAFPGLPCEGLTVTCDRRLALTHEHVQFLTWDHPLVTAALDLLLGAEQGSVALACWPDRHARECYLEAWFLLESIAPIHLHADRFLPPTPIRVLLDQQGRDATDDHPVTSFAQGLAEPPGSIRHHLTALAARSGRELIDRARPLAELRAQVQINQARVAMRAELDREILRLTELSKVNRTIRQAEIEGLRQHRDALAAALDQPRLRLEAVRFVLRGPMPAPGAPAGRPIHYGTR